MKPDISGSETASRCLNEPGPECYGDNGSILRFVDNAGIFAVLEGWFDVLEEGDR